MRKKKGLDHYTFWHLVVYANYLIDQHKDYFAYTLEELTGKGRWRELTKQRARLMALMEKDGWTIKHIALFFGRDPSNVRRTIRGVRGKGKD